MATQLSTPRTPRTIKKHEKPRPPKVNQRHSNIEGIGIGRIVTMEDLVSLVDSIASNLSNGIHTSTFQQDIITMCNTLKHCAHQFESVYKDQLDRAFVAIRNGSQDERLDLLTRIHLLELIELRAKQWRQSDSMDAYYTSKLADLDEPEQSMESNVLGSSPQPTAILNMGEVIKNSGKYAKPTRIPGKNYCKDEVVIRNSDSGKVMGIKGRRVHMIEELSETIISFQRVNPGAKERLVQITGTSEDKIHYAKDLIKETIHRNASPVRMGVEKNSSGIGGSSSSLNSSASDESNRLHQHYHYQPNVRATLLHSLSTNDASIGEYKHTVTFGNHSLKLTGSNLNLVRTAKLILDEHFSKWNNDDLDQLNSGVEFFGFQDELSSQENVKTTRETSFESNTTSESDSTFKPIKEVENETYKQTNNNRELTYELLLLCAKGPYAKRVPPEWNRIQKEYPNIIRKSPIDWFEPESYRANFVAAGMKVLSSGEIDNDFE